LADTILKNLDEEEAKYYIDRAIKFFKDHSKKNERMRKTLDREGVAAFVEYLIEFRELDGDKIVWSE